MLTDMSLLLMRVYQPIFKDKKQYIVVLKMKIMEFKAMRLFMKYIRALSKIIFVRPNIRIYTRNSIINHLGLQHLQKNCAKVEPI